MNTITAPKLRMTPSRHQRGLAAVASLLITFAVVAANLQIAQGYAPVVPVGTDTVQAAQPARG